MRLVTVEQMRQIEKQGFQAGVSYETMIQTVGKKIAGKIDAESKAGSKTIVGLIGKGNNGNDTLAVLTALSLAGWQSFACLLSDRDATDPYFSAFVLSNGVFFNIADEEDWDHTLQICESCAVILDGVYGIGFHLPLDERSKCLFSRINGRKVRNQLIAVDCPSGMDCDSGQTDPDCLVAAKTICIEAVKSGEVTAPANLLVGEIECISLDLPENLEIYQEIQREVLEPDRMKAILPKRSDGGHKGTFGNVTIVGGSDHFIGAPILAGMAAFRSGCGYVNMMTPEIVRNLTAGSFTQGIWFPQDFSSKDGIKLTDRDFKQCLLKKGSVLIGPGLGQSAMMEVLVPQLLTIVKDRDYPLILDADGINILAKLRDWRRLLPDRCIFTPHPGEMARLCQTSIADIEENRIEIAEQKAKEWGATIVLKGPFTIIASPDGRTAVMPYASSALAKAGSGDLLAGLIAGFAAQSCPAFDSACLGVWIHAKSAEHSSEWMGHPYSLLAEDILNSIPVAIRSIFQQ